MPSFDFMRENTLEKTRVDMPAAEVPSAVFTMAEVTLAPSPGFEMLPCLAPLEARNPKTRMKAPRAARGTEWPGMLTGFPPESNLPMRGPMRMQPTRAMVAGRCTYENKESLLCIIFIWFGWYAIRASAKVNHPAACVVVEPE